MFQEVLIKIMTAALTFSSYAYGKHYSFQPARELLSECQWSS